MNPKISPEHARNLLWQQGILHWLLKPVQLELYNSYGNCQQKIIVWNCARRLGKSFTLCVIALETCLKKPNSLVKYCCAKQKDAKSIIRPLIREIIDTCPNELKPEYKTQDGAWVFPNGSRIELTGLDGGRAESVRGGSSHLAIIDEAGLVGDLVYIITSIILPTTATTKGKIILASTPPKSPAHPFIQKYLNKAKLEGNLVTKTIYDNPNIDQDEFDKLVEESGGEDSVDFRREYRCVDENTLIRTKDGYKQIKDIIVTDQVFTHKGRYRPVINVFRNPLNGRSVYKLKCSNNLGHIMTEGHKVFVTTTDHYGNLATARTEWIEVQNIKPRPSERVYISVPVDVSRNEAESSDLDKAYLAGWYVAEGNCATKAQQVSFALAHKDPIDLIQAAAVSVFGKRFVQYRCWEKHGEWSINSRVAKTYFKQFGTHSTKKRVIPEVKYGSDDIKKSFLSGYIKGDGWDSGDRIAINSVCLALLGDVSDMLHSLGVGTQIQKLHSAGPSMILGRHVTIHDSYTLQIAGKNYQLYKDLTVDKRSIDFVKNGIFYSRIKKIEQIPYSKPYVYDIEVDEDHSYVGLHGTFHNCEIIKDMNFDIIPEFTQSLKKQIVVDWPRSPFYDGYVSMDVGMKDLTVVLFAWYDFKASKIIIEDEFVINGMKFNTNVLAQGIKQKEASVFTDKVTGEQKNPYMRVSDNNLIVIKDLWDLHGLNFIPTRKDDADAALNKVRILLQSEQIIINPRCTTLIAHLEAGVWEKNKKNFDRSADHGHYDAIDSLKYLVRNVQTTKNPYPAGYFYKFTDDAFTFNRPKQQDSQFLKMFNITQPSADQRKQQMFRILSKK